MKFPRQSGILLHPTSLPGPYGIGEIGREARWFANKLQETNQHLWQVLPMGPTSFGDSPYQSPSTFAGNHLLIAFDLLLRDGLLKESELKKFPEFGAGDIDYGKVIPARMEILTAVCNTFSRRASKTKKLHYERFCKREAYWLDDYALFMAIKDSRGGKPWPLWPKKLATRQPAALAEASKKFKPQIRNVKIMQFLFDDQWRRLRKYCEKRAIKIVGDIPIFVAHDSADVWAHPELYYLHENGQPEVVAGVPPDYFSATGQLWGNPLYRWDVHESTDFAWWVARIKKIFETVDIVRIDHFRGFEAYWEVPGDAETAIDGRWVKGPCERLFESFERQLGKLPIIAEDLGIITDEVEALRDNFELPGMRILQFAFGNDPKAGDYRPNNFVPNSVAYTGTHDNDTTVGWFWSEAGEGSTRSQKDIEKERAHILKYTGTDGSEIQWDLIDLAFQSKSNTAVVPLQDILGLGTEARMNVPGREGGNWGWRFERADLVSSLTDRLKNLTKNTKRA